MKLLGEDEEDDEDRRNLPCEADLTGVSHCTDWIATVRASLAANAVP